MFAMPDHERAAIKTGTQNTEDYPHVHGPQDRRMSCLLYVLQLLHFPDSTPEATWPPYLICIQV